MVPLYSLIKKKVVAAADIISAIAKQLLPRLISNIDNIANDIKRLTSNKDTGERDYEKKEMQPTIQKKKTTN